jgi:hypothetical protein
MYWERLQRGGNLEQLERPQLNGRWGGQHLQGLVSYLDYICTSLDLI